MKIIIPGEPRGKQRPRFGHGTTYTPSETVKYEKEVKALFYQAGGKKISGPVKLEIAAFYGIPQSAPSEKRNRMDDGEILPQKKPDLDNVVKIIMDGLNGAAYDDDKQVVGITAYKLYDYSPQVMVTITGVEL